MSYAMENGGIRFFDCRYLRDESTTPIPGISAPVTFEDLKPFRKSEFSVQRSPSRCRMPG